MNSLLFDVIAARASATGDPAIADLLTRMRSSPGSTSSPNIQELLAQRAKGDPALEALAKHFTESTSGPSRPAVPEVGVESVEENGESADLGKETVEGEAGAVEELREQAKSMFAELQILRQRCDLLASALGACCLCWGQERECRICRGRGRPGFATPDEALLQELVIPAIQMMRAQRMKIRGSSSTTQPEATDTDAQENEKENHNERKNVYANR